MTLKHSETMIPCPSVSTLLWDGHELVDVTSNLRVRLDGTTMARTAISAYPFDRVVGVRNDDELCSVAYANRGTKGLLMKKWRS